jgi:hypothetical protein
MTHTSARPAFIEELRAEARGYATRPAKKIKAQTAPPDPDAVRYLFTVATGNRWMELGDREPPSKMLFGEFWHQRELCILFADTNIGKSVLAVQIADSISRQSPIGPFAIDAEPAKVLYIDFELSTRQFHQRYSGPQGNYDFAEGFYRAQFNPRAEMYGDFNSYDEFIIAGLEYRIRQLKATVLIIDNITCLRGGTENASVALTLMKNLKALQADLNLSILVLAHTPKRRNPGRPLSDDDLQGSKLLINFADSAFAIGKSSTQAGTCYLKQIKQRNTQQVYGEGNVCLCSIQKQAGFLQFTFSGNSTERQHLRSHLTAVTAINRRLLIQQVAQLAAKGISQRQISLQLNIGLGTVNKLMHLNAERELPNAELPNAEVEMPNAEYELCNSECELSIAECELSNAECDLTAGGGPIWCNDPLPK